MAENKIFQAIVRFFEEAKRSNVRATIQHYHNDKAVTDKLQSYGSVKADFVWKLTIENVPGSFEFIATIPELRTLVGSLRSIPSFVVLEPEPRKYKIIYSA